MFSYWQPCVLHDCKHVTFTLIKVVLSICKGKSKISQIQNIPYTLIYWGLPYRPKMHRLKVPIERRSYRPNVWIRDSGLGLGLGFFTISSSRDPPYSNKVSSSLPGCPILVPETPIFMLELVPEAPPPPPFLLCDSTYLPWCAGVSNPATKYESILINMKTAYEF